MPAASNDGCCGSAMVLPARGGCAGRSVVALRARRRFPQFVASLAARCLWSHATTRSSGTKT